MTEENKKAIVHINEELQKVVYHEMKNLEKRLLQGMNKLLENKLSVNIIPENNMISENKKQTLPVLIIEHGIEYTIYPRGMPCNDPDCVETKNFTGQCPTCFRIQCKGEGKVPTGKRLLNG